LNTHNLKKESKLVQNRYRTKTGALKMGKGSLINNPTRSWEFQKRRAGKSGRKKWNFYFKNRFKTVLLGISKTPSASDQRQWVNWPSVWLSKNYLKNWTDTLWKNCSLGADWNFFIYRGLCWVGIYSMVL